MQEIGINNNRRNIDYYPPSENRNYLNSDPFFNPSTTIGPLVDTFITRDLDAEESSGIQIRSQVHIIHGMTQSTVNLKHFDYIINPFHFPGRSVIRRRRRQHPFDDNSDAERNGVGFTQRAIRARRVDIHPSGLRSARVSVSGHQSPPPSGRVEAKENRSRYLLANRLHVAAGYHFLRETRRRADELGPRYSFMGKTEVKYV